VAFCPPGYFQETGAVGTSVLTGLGHALRWLRDRHGRKQYQVADAAGITKGMLSAYETGRQKPSLDTMEKLLDTLGCNLHDLHNALQIVNGRPTIPRSREAEPGWPAGAEVGLASLDVRQLLGLRGPLGAEEEEALQRLIEAFHHLVRIWRRNASGESGGATA
jgi:transcriptional regulator with XRE-family HTH domain